MKLRWVVPFAVLFPLGLRADDKPVQPTIQTLLINPAEVTPLHLRPGFISTIRMPEEVNSIALGSRTDFNADHSEGEPFYVYVRPITKEPTQSNLVIATKSGLHVTLELISDGAGQSADPKPVDFLIEYRRSHNSLIAEVPVPVASQGDGDIGPSSSRNGFPAAVHEGTLAPPSSELDTEYMFQQRINSPEWTRWPGQQIKTSLGDIRQSNNRTIVAFSLLNDSANPVEIVPPQVQIAGKKNPKKKKKGNGVIADQLETKDYRLSETRLEPGARADGVIIFDRPNFKRSSEKLLLQVAQANQADHPVLIELPFTPPLTEAQPKGGIK